MYLRSAARSLIRRPLGPLAATVSLGIGMSLVTSIVALLNDVILKPPFADAGGVVRLYEQEAGGGPESPIAPARHVVALQASGDFAAVGAILGQSRPVILGQSGEAATVWAAYVTRDFFRVLGVRPSAGVWFEAEPSSATGPVPMVISYALWQTRFGGASNLGSQPVALNGHVGRIIGVAPDGFGYPKAAQVWVPLSDDDLSARAMLPLDDAPAFDVLARLRPRQPGTDARVQTIISRADMDVGLAKAAKVRVLSVASVTRREHAGQIAVWSSLSIVILFLCAVNFATFMLARSLDRVSEIAVRSALGASRRQLTVTLLVDAVIMSVVAGLVAVSIATWMRGLIVFSLTQGETIQAVSLRPSVVGIGMLATIVVGAGFSLAPAFQLASPDLRRFLAQGSVAGSAGSGVASGRSALVALQLFLAALCIGSVVALVRADSGFDYLGPGYDYKQVISATLLAPDSSARVEAEREISDIVRSRPCVEAVGFQRMPQIGKGATLVAPDTRPSASAGFVWFDISPAFFTTLGIRPIAGRLPTSEEIATRAPVVLLSQSATRSFDNVNPVGRRVKMKSPGQAAVWRTVIGVVPDIRRGPIFQWGEGYAVYTMNSLPIDSVGTNFVVRVHGDVNARLADLRVALRAMGSRVIVTDLRSVATDVEQSAVRSTSRHIFLGGVALLSLVIACVGAFTLSAHNTAMRAKEISIRVALGAGRTEIGKLVLGGFVPLAVAGIVVGELAAMRFWEILDAALRDPRQLFLPPVPFPHMISSLATITLLAVVIAGCVIPIRRVLRRSLAASLR
jgi:putative ABC transport system permease protein